MTPKRAQRHRVLLGALCATTLMGLGCDPIVLESDECQKEPLASLGLALGEPVFAPLPQQPSLLPGLLFGLPAVATDGTGFLVVWQTHSSLLAVRLSGTGEVLDMPPLVAGSNDRTTWNRPAVTFDGANYVIVWNRWGLGVWGARITPSGQLLEPGGVPLGTGPQVATVDVATAGDRTLMAWARTVGAAHVAPLSGVTLGDPITLKRSSAPSAISSLALAAGGSTWGLAASGLGADHDTVISMVSFFEWEPFAALSDFELAAPGPREREIDLAAGAGEFLAVWGTGKGSRNIEGVRVTPTGPQGAVLPITFIGIYHRDPQVSFDGARFQVAWMGYAGVQRSVLSTAVSASGAVAVPDGAVVGGSQHEHIGGVALASAGGRTLAAYLTQLPDPADRPGLSTAVTTAWLSESGGRVGPDGGWLSLGKVFRGRPRVLATPSGYVVLWREFGQSGIALGGARLGPDGEVLSSVGSRPLGTGKWENSYMFDAATAGEHIFATVPTDGEDGIRLLGPNDTWFTALPTPPQDFLRFFKVAASGETALVSWQSYLLKSLLVIPLSPNGMTADAGEIVSTSASGGVLDWAIEATDGGFAAVTFGEQALRFLNLDLGGRVLSQSQLDISTGAQGPVYSLELGGAPTALFRVVDGGVSLLGAVAEGGVPRFPVVLGDLRSDRLARAPFGAQNLLGWIASSDGATVPRGVWLEATLGSVEAEPFTWPLEAGVTELDVAARSATEGLIAYAVGDAVESNIAWRRITRVDGGACDEAFLARVPQVGPACSQAQGNVAGLVIACAFALSFLWRRRR